MVDRIADTHEEFFARVGHAYIHPKQWGECIFPVSVEEMYQHFKARLISEVEAVQQLRDGIHQVFPLRASHSATATQEPK